MTEDQEMVDCFYGLPEGNEFNNLFMPEESFLNLPNTADNDSPLDFVRMKPEQQNDAELMNAQTKHPEIYFEKKLEMYPTFYAT